MLLIHSALPIKAKSFRGNKEGLPILKKVMEKGTEVKEGARRTGREKKKSEESWMKDDKMQGRWEYILEGSQTSVEG